MRRWHTGQGLWLLVFFATLLVFLTTAHWYGALVTDTSAASWGGWALAHGYGNDLTGAPGVPTNPFITVVEDRLVVQRTAGVVLASTPVQLLLWPLGLSAETVGVLTAALLSAAAMGNIALLVARMTGRLRTGAVAAGVLAFGTPVWTVCSAELWTHSPTVFWISCLLLAAQRNAWWWAAATAVPLIWARPHLGLAVAIVAASAAWGLRSVRPLVSTAIGCAVGVAGLSTWNAWMFGDTNVAGSYAGQVQAATQAVQLQDTLLNGLGAFLSPARGLFVYTPLAALALLVVLHRWRALPCWSQGALLGGLAYQAAQIKLNSFVGGGGFFGNRLAVELLVLGTPAAVLALVAFAREISWAPTVIRPLAAASVAAHGLGAMLAGTGPIVAIPQDPWREWVLARAVQAAGAAGAAVATAIVGAAVLGIVLAGRVRLSRLAGLAASARTDR